MKLESLQKEINLKTLDHARAPLPVIATQNQQQEKVE